MKTFEHRATVKAARILRIDPSDRAPFLPDLDDGTEDGFTEEMSYRAWAEAAKDVLSGNPLGYLVIHPNGLDGYVPKATFEAEFLEIRAQAPAVPAVEPAPQRVTAHSVSTEAPVAALPAAPPAPPRVEPPAQPPVTAPAAPAPSLASPKPARPLRNSNQAAASAKEQILDLYASSTLTHQQIADKLSAPVGTVAGTLWKSRQSGDQRVTGGDKARLKQAKPAPATAAPITTPTRKPTAPIVPARPLPAPVKNAVSENARAASVTRDRVLDHYQGTGDYEAVMAQRLGILRATVKAIMDDARSVGERRLRLGDIKRKAKERGK